MNAMTRRDFSKAAAVTALSSMRILGANDRVRVGFIGVGNRGDQVLDAFLKNRDAQVVAVCDVYEPYLEPAARKAGGDCARLKDYRKLLEMKDLDAVAIVTPDHWHALQFIHACEAGKDIYVEKPLSLVVSEGRKMVEAARKHKRVTQVGLQRRSSPGCREACEAVRSGAIGQVTVVKSYHVLNEWPMGIASPADTKPPDGLDWDAWLGPAPAVPYNANRCLYKFRWFWDYSGGQVTNFGTHYLDMIQQALGKDAPQAVVAMGGKYAVEDNREIPDTLEVLWKYRVNGGAAGGGQKEANVLVGFSQYNCNAAHGNIRGAEIEFRGTNGTLYMNDGSYEIVPESIREEPLPNRSPLYREENRRAGNARRKAMDGKVVKGRVLDEDHSRNFLDCVKSRKPCNCDIETGHRSTSATLLGNIAYKTRSYLEWDSKAERFTNNEAANKLLSYKYRAPWKLA